MPQKKRCDGCATPPAFPVSGTAFTRRHVLRLGGLGLFASFFSDAFGPSLLDAATMVSPALRGTARNCILIFLDGAPSHADLWDLKEGSWTPAALAPTSYGDLRWPQGVLPKTAAHLDKLAIVRSGMAWVAVHQLGQRWAQIGQNPAGILGTVAPHIGSVVALESQRTRLESDILPAFVALYPPRASAGYFSAKYGPLTLRLRSVGRLGGLHHADGSERLAERMALLEQLDSERTGTLGKHATDFADLYPDALRLTATPEIAPVFEITQTEHARYGSSFFGNSLILAKQLVAANRGTRFVQATFGGWDDHNEIYASLPARTRTFDNAFATLLDDLSTSPGSTLGKTLLDETLIVVYAEFGRTVGPLNNQKGRDHYARMSIVLAGGGVTGRRIIGATDSLGDKATEYGWHAQRDVRPEDVTATIYSALGIDYTTVRYDDPMKRGFEYVPGARDGAYEPVDELFRT